MRAVGAIKKPVGQVIITTLGNTTWTVPAGVTSYSVVAVESSGSRGATTVTQNSVIVCRALNGARIGDGGGDGGYGGPDGGGEVYYAIGGGGGAGGYSGPGGNGGYGETDSGPRSGGGYASGGAGGGGSGGPGVPFSASYYYRGGGGGGVGLYGEGASGRGGSPAYAGDPNGGGGGGSGGGDGDYPGYNRNGFGGNYGGGFSNGLVSDRRGGSLSYKNNVTTSPGTQVSIFIATPPTGGGQGAVRIIWGENRSFPSTNTGDL